NQWELMKYTLLIPIYWFFMSIAAGFALYQLVFKPHYWEKTTHGLHLGKSKRRIQAAKIPALAQPYGLPVPSLATGGSWNRYSTPPLREMGSQQEEVLIKHSFFIPI